MRVGVYGLLGKSAGDLREREKYRGAGIITIVTRVSWKKAKHSIFYLSILVYLLVFWIDDLALEQKLFIVTIMFLVNIIWISACDLIKDRYKHGSVHGVKCIFFVFLGIILSDQYYLLGNMIFGIGSVWSGAYYLYLRK